MNNLRKLAGISIFFILIFMVIALLQFQQQEEEQSMLPDQIEYNFNEDWEMASLESNEVSWQDLKDQEKVDKWCKDVFEEECQEVDLPYAGDAAKAGGTFIFRNTIPVEYAGLTLNFSSTAARVQIILDGTILYQYGMEENKGSKELAGKSDHFVDIPKVFQEGNLWIVLISPDPDAVPVLNNFKVESRDVVVIGLVGNNIADIGCCLLIMLVAIIMFVLALIRRYTGQPARGELFLGLTGMSAGFYCFIGTDTLSIFYDVQEAYEMQEYLVLLIPLFLTLYFDRNLRTIYPRRFSVLLCGVILNAALQILLQLLQLKNLEDMLNISAAIVGAVCVIAIVSLIQFDYRNKSYQTWLSILSVIVLLSGGIANVIMNTFFENVRGNTAGQYSMTLFCIMMAVMHVLQLSKEYRARAEESAKLLEEKVKVTEQQNTQLIQAKKDADAARQEALAANEAKGKFLARMSHEIRTPINAVLGMDEMILRESREQNIKDYAMDIYMAGQTLLSLINDILDFSKIDSGKMEIVPVEYDVSSLIHDLANMAAQRAKAKEIKLQVEAEHTIPSRLYGDDVRIRQVLTNILTNAVKYTHEGTVWFRIQGRREEKKAVLRFEVEDTGIGIKEEDLPKLSAEFERIEEDRNRNIEGTGLGINITIQLLELLGSKLQVESVYGKGSKFYFELEQEIMDDTPIGDFESRVHQLAENYSYNTRFCAPDAAVLVVDDNAVNRKVFRNLLKETQIQVAEAAGGLECLECVQNNHYDLIFLDHMMPEMDGLETFHHIKEFDDFPCQNTPIIVLTANAVSGARERYLAEGFDDFLSKPIVPEKLENMIRELLPKQLLQEVSLDKETKELSKDSEIRPENMLEELPQVDGLDWQYAWMHLPDMELLEYTVKEFYAQIDSAAEHLEEAYEQIAEPEWLEQYRIQVHAMKSLAATVGILPLSGLAKLLEYAAKDGKINVILSVTDAFLEEWRSYQQKLQGVFGIGTEEKKKVTDPSVIQALVEMVRISMQQMDIDQADQWMKQLQEYEYSDEMKQNIKRLAEAVTNLDAEEADQIGDLLIDQMKR
ncbi:MAG: response regulator [Lachnospiraceae bacterium]|nr:response regulator [Lachnospiraceae bacterium]